MTLEQSKARNCALPLQQRWLSLSIWHDPQKHISTTIMQLKHKVSTSLPHPWQQILSSSALRHSNRHVFDRPSQSPSQRESLASFRLPHLRTPCSKLRFHRNEIHQGCRAAAILLSSSLHARRPFWASELLPVMICTVTSLVQKASKGIQLSNGG